MLAKVPSRGEDQVQRMAAAQFTCQDFWLVIRDSKAEVILWKFVPSPCT